MTRNEMSDLQPFDASEYLDSDEAVEAFFNDAWESGSRLEIADALTIIAKAKGAQTAVEAAGLSAKFHDQPADMDDLPDWDVLLLAIKALGLKLVGAMQKPAA